MAGEVTDITDCVCGRPPGHNRCIIYCEGCMVWLHANCMDIYKRMRLPEKWFCTRCTTSCPKSAPMQIQKNLLRKEVDNLRNEFHTFKDVFNGAERNRISELKNITAAYREVETNVKTELLNLNNSLNELKHKDERQIEQWVKEMTKTKLSLTYRILLEISNK